MVCKGKVTVGEDDVGRTVECGDCFSVFVVHKTSGNKLTLDYPEVGSDALDIRENPG